MVCKSRAIVLKTIKYSETSLVVKAFTEQFGLKSFLVRSVRKKHAKNSPNLFQPLNILEIVFSEKESTSLIIPKEISIGYSFQSIPFDLYKSSIILFMNELIYRSVHEEEANPELFQFLFQSIVYIDSTTERISNTHLVFSFQLTQHLGFYPLGSFTPEKPYFLLREGIFSKHSPEDDFSLDQEESMLLDSFINSDLESCHEIEISNALRNRMLEIIILYYQLHLIGFGEIKSLDVLNQVFHS
jgi:DNA repair protein RecO (recombination protein O)